jgi:phosphatidylglycerophosphate synthase
MSHDTLIHALVRPVVRKVAGSGITPNQVTTLRLVTGLLGAVGFAQGGVLWPCLGAGFMLLSVLLDRADGELARQTGKMSQGGYRYDLICDCAATVASFIGMGFGVQSVFGPAAIAMGVVAGVSVAVVFWLINVVKLTPIKAPDGAERRVILDPDDAMILAPFFVWFGVMPWAVAIACVATPIVAIALGIVGLKARRRESRA